MSLFALFDIPTVRASKNSQVEIESVSLDTLWLNIDNQKVRLKKEVNGTLSLSCDCEFCGKKGIAKQQLCRRQQRALFYLIQMNGRVSEIMTKPKGNEILLGKKVIAEKVKHEIKGELV